MLTLNVVCCLKPISLQVVIPHQSFLIYDNVSLNYVQPTNYIKLEELAFTLQSKVFFTVIISYLIIGSTNIRL